MLEEEREDRCSESRQLGRVIYLIQTGINAHTYVYNFYEIFEDFQFCEDRPHINLMYGYLKRYFQLTVYAGFGDQNNLTCFLAL